VNNGAHHSRHQDESRGGDERMGKVSSKAANEAVPQVFKAQGHEDCYQGR